MTYNPDNQQAVLSSSQDETKKSSGDHLELFAEEMPSQQDLVGIATASTFSTLWGSTAGTLASFSSK